MIGVGVFVAWLGYGVFYFGLDQIRGGNNGFLSLLVPGKYTNQPSDSPSNPAASGTTGAPGLGGVAKTPGNPKGVSAWNATSAPKGAPAGSYRVDQDGNIQVFQNGAWVPYSIANLGTVKGFV